MDEAARQTCLVLAPFQGSWAAVHDAVADALHGDGVVVRWLNADAELDSPTAASIHEYLERADVVVADLTERNANVMYEMGFAHALGKPVLPVVERRVEKVPPAIRGRLFFVYDPNKPESLIAFLRSWMVRYLVDQTLGERVG